MVSVNPPSGFRDFIHDDARRRLQLMSMISTVYQSFGFTPLETPVLENLELLLGSGGGEENEKLIFKVLKRGDKLAEALLSQDEAEIAEFGLRFDLTLPLSRVVAHHRGQIRLPWKVFHMGPVWRAERPQKGRFREFIQCDVDIIGAQGIGAEAEVIQAVVAAVHQIGARGFELRLNDRRLIQAIAEKNGFYGEKLEQFAVILDKKDKIDLSEIKTSLKKLLPNLLPNEDFSSELLALVEGSLTLDAARSLHEGAVDDLKRLISILEGLELPLEAIVFDPSLVRGMGYYTGPVFELRHRSAGYSFGGGGRYDQLIGRLGGSELPACGFSIGFERLALLLAETESQQKFISHHIFIPVFNEKIRGSVLVLAAQLRASGLSVDVFPDQAKIKNQFKFASDSGYRWVLIVGEDELVSQIFKFKDFKTGTEVQIPASEVVDQVKLLSQSKKD